MQPDDRWLRTNDQRPTSNVGSVRLAAFMSAINQTLPQLQPAAANQLCGKTLLPGIALSSFSALLLELALTRLFSVVLFYHFAFLAISVALLGLGGGGVFAYIFRDRLSRWTIPQLGGSLLCANAVIILIVLEVVLHSAVSLNLELRNFGKLTVLYLAA